MDEIARHFEMLENHLEHAAVNGPLQVPPLIVEPPPVIDLGGLDDAPPVFDDAPPVLHDPPPLLDDAIPEPVQDDDARPVLDDARLDGTPVLDAIPELMDDDHDMDIEYQDDVEPNRVAADNEDPQPNLADEVLVDVAVNHDDPQHGDDLEEEEIVIDQGKYY